MSVCVSVCVCYCAFPLKAQCCSAVQPNACLPLIPVPFASFPITFPFPISLLLIPKKRQKVDLRHMDEKSGSNVVDVGVDLSEFYMSVEWDILEVPAVR